jgi:hypothetical protein
VEKNAALYGCHVGQDRLLFSQNLLCTGVEPIQVIDTESTDGSHQYGHVEKGQHQSSSDSPFHDPFLPFSR